MCLGRAPGILVHAPGRPPTELRHYVRVFVIVLALGIVRSGMPELVGIDVVEARILGPLLHHLADAGDSQVGLLVDLLTAARSQSQNINAFKVFGKPISRHSSSSGTWDSVRFPCCVISTRTRWKMHT